MAETNLKKNKEGYGYKYTELAEIHNYLESINAKYIQFIKRIDGDDYIMTKRCFNENWEEEALQGCKVVQATLSGKSNPAQEQGSALTYARRYSLLMAFGLATEDDDGASLSRAKVDNEKIIDTKMVESLNKAIENNNISDEVLMIVLQKYGYDRTSEIKIKDYMNIVNDLKPKKVGV